MMRIAILAGLIFAAGCKKDITADIEAIAEKTCACKDADCANKAVDELTSLDKSAGGDEKRVTAAATKLGECAIKAGVDPSALMAKMQKLAE
ncbi:MAG: hypothetical protein K8W52_28335 [Deltaproteobacteria bacterium]|nr:hypothetical protein [Deltaproteobacteria bacterium]